MKNTIVRLGLVAALALSTGFGLAACGGGTSSGSEAGTSTEAAAPAAGEEAGVNADLELARQTVLTTLEERGDMPEIYLASDVDEPEEKYGMLVVPYHPSDAIKKLTTSIVKIDGGKFVIGAESAETGKVWTIDQDGKIAEKTD